MVQLTVPKKNFKNKYILPCFVKDTSNNDKQLIITLSAQVFVEFHYVTGSKDMIRKYKQTYHDLLIQLKWHCCSLKKTTLFFLINRQITTKVHININKR